MRDPRPMQMVLGGIVLTLLLFVLWWASLPQGERQRILLAVAQEEGVPGLPPAGLVSQAQWLISHRLSVVEETSGLLGLALLIGSVEGWLRRGRDVHGGFLLTWWTTGIIAGLLLAGGTLVTLCLPWPIARWSVPTAGGLLGGLVGYGITAGRPYVP